MRWSGNTIAPAQRSADGWGQQIRSYVIGRGAKDLRTGLERPVERVLEGDIDDFMRAALAWESPGNAAIPDHAS